MRRDLNTQANKSLATD